MHIKNLSALVAIILLIAAVPAVAAQDDAVTALEEQIINVYEEVNASVVNITARSVAFDSSLNPIPQAGTGTGWVYDDAGHIITNFHVVEGAETLQVTLADGRLLPANIVGVDPSNDLAVLQVKEPVEGLQPVPLGDSDALRVGQFVVAIGSPFGLEQTLTVGVISSLGRVIQSPDGRFIGEIVQTDAAINPGNSGGPLLNRQGEVVGVNTAIISPSMASAGISFSVPVNTVKRVVPALIGQGHFAHPWLGVNLFDLTPRSVDFLSRIGEDVPVTSGVLVLEVAPNGPAGLAGLRGGTRRVQIGDNELPLGGDIITALDGEPLRNARDFTVLLETQFAVGDVVALTIIREGKEQILEAVADERPYTFSPPRE